MHSINAAVEMTPVAGSTYSGLIEEYHDVGGFILAAQPEKIRVIGQAPVLAKNIFDMTSDGKVFRIFIPSKNKFLVRPDRSGASLRQTDRKFAAAAHLGGAFLASLPSRAASAL